MKKAASILTIMALALGMFSCEPETTAQETDALYGTINNNPTLATDKEDTPSNPRGWSIRYKYFQGLK